MIAKYQRRFPGFDEKIVSMHARGMSVREIQANLRELYGLDALPDLISTVTDAVLDEIANFLHRLLRAIRANWPGTQILMRAVGHYCCPEVIDFCRVNSLDFILGVVPTSPLRKHIEALETSTKARFEAGARKSKLRRFKESYDGAASWSRVERICRT